MSWTRSSSWRDVPQLSTESPSLAEIEAEQCSRSLGRFMRDAWHVVEPDTPLIGGWHLDAIVEHLEAVARSEIRNLVINVPPGTTKSLTAAVFWPAWVWTWSPSYRWLFAAYAEKLSIRDSGKCRKVVRSEWYQVRWPLAMSIAQDTKTRFENERTGYRIATSVGGVGTGEKGDAIVVDDPHNVLEAESTAKREEVLMWWDEVMSTRLNDPKTGVKVIVMQRVHERDLSAHVLEQGGYDHLMLPMEYDPKRSCVTSLGFEDPRLDAGELLCPERFPDEVLDDLKIRLGPYGTAGQLQQTPAPRSGGMFDRDWFKVVDLADLPDDLEHVGYVDKAATEGGGSRSAMVLVSYAPDTGTAYIRDMYAGQWEMANRERRIDATCESWAALLGGRVDAGRRMFKLWVEQEPGSGGKDSALLTVQRLVKAGFLADRDVAHRDKFARADHFAGAAKAGLVKLVRGPWNEDLLRELEAAGPGAAFLDQMDVCVGAYNKLIGKRRTPPVAAVGGVSRSRWNV